MFHKTEPVQSGEAGLTCGEKEDASISLPSWPKALGKEDKSRHYFSTSDFHLHVVSAWKYLFHFPLARKFLIFIPFSRFLAPNYLRRIHYMGISKLVFYEYCTFKAHIFRNYMCAQSPIVLWTDGKKRRTETVNQKMHEYKMKHDGKAFIND